MKSVIFNVFESSKVIRMVFARRRSWTEKHGRAGFSPFILVALLRAHICREYYELYSCRKNMSRGVISAFYTEFEQIMEFYRSLCRFLFQIYVEKICAEKIFVEIKWEIWGLALLHYICQLSKLWWFAHRHNGQLKLRFRFYSSFDTGEILTQHKSLKIYESRPAVVVYEGQTKPHQ